MKNLILILTTLLFLTGCLKNPEYHSNEVTLVFDFPEGVDSLVMVDIPVNLTNLDKSYSVTAYTNSKGVAVFSGIEPGFYSAQLTKTYKEGNTVKNANAFGNQTILEDMSDTLDVVISETQALVIKEYYYSACLTPAGNQYSADQFVEIYNNSEDTLYADGLSLCEHESYDIEPYYFSYIEDTIVCRMIWTIPGEGTDHPIYPGTSIVLARDAFDHKSDPYGNPLCPVDLAHADFEFFVYSASGDDIDGPYSENLIEDLFTFRGTDIVFHTRGGSAIAIARIPGNDAERKEFIANNLVQKDEVTSTRYYGKIPVSFVLDAVEVVWDEAHAVYKRLPVELDAGYTYNEAGTKTGLSLRRKIQETVDGRVIYKDTNNSTEDFYKGVTPKPWVYEEE